MADLEKAARLKWARETSGYEFAADAARRLGIPVSTQQGRENGSRGFKMPAARTYERVFNIRLHWLLTGEGPARDEGAAVAIQGVIGPLGMVMLGDNNKMPDLVNDLLTIPPDGGEFIAYRVAGDANFPAFFDGDLVYTRLPGDPDRAVGKQSVAYLADGTRRVCIIARGSASGLYMLMSFNATPVPDAQLTEAAPIVWIKRGE